MGRGSGRAPDAFAPARRPVTDMRRTSRPSVPARAAAAPLLLAVCLTTVPAAGQTGAVPVSAIRDTGLAARSAAAEKVVEARPLADAVRVDGRLDDAAWGEAEWISGFVQKEPDEGAPATQRTEVAFLFDREALYVGARMHSDDPAEIGATVTRRDEGGNAERLIVSLDTYRDRRTAYSFAVTAAGVRLDWVHPSDSEHHRDHTFDPVWTARTEVTAEGWTAEMRIPFSQLRFDGGEAQVWGLNVNRYVPARNEDVFWIAVPKDRTGWASWFGEMRGLREIGGTRRIEARPYVAGEATLTDGALLDADDPFRDRLDGGMRGGLDLQMGLGPSLTLDATVNPDFGQVEADPAQVNLSGFETFFSERRPFFTEGRQMLESPGPSYYYSRRIGAPPHGDPDADFVLVPNTTTILGAAKLTGRPASGLTLGALAAVTGREEARVFDVETQEVERVRVEPVTGYGVVRLQREFGPDASTLGATLTGVRRAGMDLDPDEPLAGLLPTQALTGGVDWNRRWDGGAYELLGHVGFSRVSGDTAAILALQERFSHRYQRPDASHVDVDAARTALSGWSAALRGGKRSGRWRWNGGVWADSPGFDLNDAGRLGRADEISQWSHLFYRETRPGRTFREWGLHTGLETGWNFGGVRRWTILVGSADARWSNWIYTELDGRLGLRSLNDDATRGGPLMVRPQWWSAELEVGGNPAARTGWYAEAEVGGDELDGWNARLSAELSTRPTDRLRLAVEPRWTRLEESRQYLDQLDGGRAETFGTRYLFGRIERSEVAAPVRLSYAFSPDLSLELYAEPFASSGRYFGLGELEAPRTADLVVYGEEGGTTLVRDEEAGEYVVTADGTTFRFEDPDFRVLSFRSNAVLRWEWRPGSTLFVVWQQDRADSADLGRPVGPGELGDALTADGRNVLAIKATYWLPL